LTDSILNKKGKKMYELTKEVLKECTALVLEISPHDEEYKFDESDGLVVCKIKNNNHVEGLSVCIEPLENGLKFNETERDLTWSVELNQIPVWGNGLTLASKTGSFDDMKKVAIQYVKGYRAFL
jgi:hypothetical protein